MKHNVFDRLEKRIAQAVELIAHLRDTNARLEAERDELRAQLETTVKERDAARADLETLRDQSVSKLEYETRKAEIERRVASLLERFDELDETTAESAEA